MLQSIPYLIFLLLYLNCTNSEINSVLIETGNKNEELPSSKFPSKKNFPENATKRPLVQLKPASKEKSYIFKSRPNSINTFAAKDLQAILSQLKEADKRVGSEPQTLVAQRASRQLSGISIDRLGRVSYKLLWKQDLANIGGCSLRDLRNIDPEYRYNYPVFIARRNATLVSIEHLKAMLMWDKVYIFGYNHEDASQFIDFLRQQIYANKEGLPFELLALESILGLACKLLTNRLDEYRPDIMRLLGQKSLDYAVGFKLFHPRLNELYPLKAFLNEMHTSIQEIRRAIFDILVSDEDMAEMYLTAKERGVQIKNHHTEVEEIFETYLMQIEYIASDVQEYQNDIRSTEELVEIELDIMRNRILQVEMILSISTFFVSCGAFVTGIFGMNLLSGFEAHPLMFYLIVAVLFGSIASCFGALFSYFKKHKLL